MGFTVNLMANTDDLLVANKTLSTIKSTSGDFRETVDWLNPTFKISCTSAEIGASNYLECQAGGVNRYYHIVGAAAITTDLYSVTCKADLRKTAYYSILGASGIVCRQTNNYDMYLPDGRIPVDARKNLNTYTFSDPFAGETRAVHMQVLGGT